MLILLTFLLMVVTTPAMAQESDTRAEIRELREKLERLERKLASDEALRQKKSVDEQRDC
jgi:membrane protein insertase Oxa1/YidC/SpoIIIJ